MSEDSMQDIVNRIKSRRLELKYSFQDLADLTKMSKSTLQRYESGAIKNLPLDKLKILATALDTTPEWIMGWSRPIDELDKKVLELYPDFVPGKNYLPQNGKGNKCVPIDRAEAIAIDNSLDCQLKGIDFALWGEVKEMTEGQKQDVLDYIKFKKSQRRH